MTDDLTALFWSLLKAFIGVDYRVGGEHLGSLSCVQHIGPPCCNPLKGVCKAGAAAAGLIDCGGAPCRPVPDHEGLIQTGVWLQPTQTHSHPCHVALIPYHAPSLVMKVLYRLGYGLHTHTHTYPCHAHTHTPVVLHPFV